MPLSENPLLQNWTAPFGLPPFADIQDHHFGPAMDQGLAKGRAAITAIAQNPDAPSFTNTIAALEQAEATLDRVAGVFFNLASADSTTTREELQREFAPKLAAYASWVANNTALFVRIETLWNTRDTLGLTDEQARVLDLTYRRFMRAGAGLGGAQAARLTDILARLAVLGTEFEQNLLADERDWVMPLGDDDLAGLPDFVIAAARAAAQDRAMRGAIITLSRSLIVPFLQFSPRRDLRERAYRAWVARGANGGATDNRAIATEILALRAERATLLGYDSFADFKLAPEMAGTPGAVRDLLTKVWQPAQAKAHEDAQILHDMMRADGVNDDLAAWDWRYYSEMRRLREHDLDEAVLKPYFALDAMIEAVFDCAHRLFNLSFRPLDIALYHPDARAWEVTRSGQHIAVFIGDYFARPSKRSGAWCSAMREQSKLGGNVRPIVVNICNFTKGDPSLLSYDDARTLFHEFGHALHQMLSDVTYGSISGTSVARDFVELPSQLFEHWLEVPEVLRKHARHVETGAPIPQDMLHRLLAARSYDMGFQTVEYVASAMVDLEFHTGPAPTDPMAMQAQILADIGMPPAIGMRHATPHFAHVFSGDGYSSGYYSYMWSEVMDADAFAAFEETGDPFNSDLAAKLERHILSAGNTAEADTLYTAFRGRMPDVGPLLQGRGLV